MLEDLEQLLAYLRDAKYLPQSSNFQTPATDGV